MNKVWIYINAISIFFYSRFKRNITAMEMMDSKQQTVRICLVFHYLTVVFMSHNSQFNVQWNPSCEATPFASEKWPFKKGGLSSGVEINTFMFRFTLSSGLFRGGGLSSGWPLKRGSTVIILIISYYTNNEKLWLRCYRYFHEVKDGILASLNRTFHFSPIENIWTITLMKNILYNIKNISLSFTMLN